MSDSPVRPCKEGVTIDVLVNPRASRSRIGPRHGDRLKVAITAPPVDGAANNALIDLFSRALSLPRSQVEVSAGLSSRRKTLTIRGVEIGAALELLE